MTLSRRTRPATPEAATALAVEPALHRPAVA